jgi:ipoprotein LpqH
MSAAIPLVACSSHSTPVATGVSTGGSTEVKVDGNELPGLDLKTVSCVKQGGRIDIGSGQIGGQQGLGVVMTNEPTPKVQSLGMVVDGNALSVSDNMGVKVGSADVSVSGSTYTITGQAQGADLQNPLSGPVTKNFTIKVTCG